MSEKKFNRKYREYQPAITSAQGPPTQRICKQVKCEDGNTTPTP